MAKESFQALLVDGAVGVYAGSGAPEGNVAALAGSIYLRKDGGVDTSAYFKESGSGASGWVSLPIVPSVGTTTGTVAAGDDPRFQTTSPVRPTTAGLTDGQVVWNSQPVTGEAAGWLWSDTLYAWIDLTTVGDVPHPHAPSHVVAVQGPTDPTNLYAWVTWDRNDTDATGYNVYRDGVLVGTTTDGGGADDWDKRAYQDTGVSANTTHSFQVSAVDGSDEGLLSRPYDLHIRATTDASKEFDIGDFGGANVRAQLVNALVAARASGPTYSVPAVINFPAGTYSFGSDVSGSSLTIGDDNIILRGEGMSSTIFQATFGGSASESGTDRNIIKWLGTTSPITGLNPSVAVVRGDKFVTLETATDFAVGDTIWLNNITSTFASADDSESYDAWDLNYVERIDGNTVHVRNPWAKPFPITASVGKLVISGCGIEQMTLEGASNAETGYYTLLALEHCRSHSITECRFKWFNRNAIYIRGYKNRIVGCEFVECDPRVLAGESQRYVVSSGRGSHLKVIANTFGEVGTESSSLITNSVSHRQVVRHNQFLNSENYGWNSHGAADYWDVVENNYIYMPTAAKGGVFLGNTSFVYAGPTRIRGNLFDTCNTAAISCQQNTYGLIAADNWFRDCPDDLIYWFGAALPNMLAATKGSARSVIRRNQVDGTQPARGFIFGTLDSPTPFAGVSDLVIDSNVIDVAGSAIILGGSDAETNDFQVYGNTGSSQYDHPPFAVGDHWADNEDSSPATGGTDDATPYFADTFSGTAGTSAGWPVYLRSTTTGTGSNFTVSSSGNYGRLSATSASAPQSRKVVCALRSEVVTDSNQLIDFRNATTTTSRLSTLIARHQSSTSATADRYRCVYEYGTGVTNRFRIEKVIGGVATVLAQTTSFDAALTHDLRVRFTVTGTTLEASAWDAVSGSEPGSPSLSITDSSITNNGRCGVGMDCPNAQTSTSDVDNYKFVTWTRAAVADFGTQTAMAFDVAVWDWELLDGQEEMA